MILRTGITLLAFLIIASTGLAFGNEPVDVDPILEHYVKTYNLPAVAVVVTRGDEIIYDGAAGDDRSLGTTTTTYIASISKPITATAVMILHERGRLDINAPITTYLDNFHLLDGREDDVTAANLLNHTSGISSRNFKYTPQDHYTVHDVVEQLQGAALFSEPGASFSYSNVGYNLLGALVERVSGQSFTDFVTKEIFTPLGMENTTTIAKEDVTVQGYTSLLGVKIARHEKVYNSEIPSGFIISSAVDLSRFLRFQRTGKDLYGNTILQKATLDTMRNASSEAADYALGWAQEQYDTLNAYGHDGGLANFLSKAIYIPESDTTVTVLTNINNLPISMFVFPELCHEIVYKLHGKNYDGSDVLKWLVILFPLLILADVISEIFSTKKLFQRCLKDGTVLQKDLIKKIVSHGAVLLVILFIPHIVSLVMNRGISFADLWGLTPNFTILMLLSGSLTGIKLVILTIAFHKMKRGGA